MDKWEGSILFNSLVSYKCINFPGRSNLQDSSSENSSVLKTGWDSWEHPETSRLLLAFKFFCFLPLVWYCPSFSATSALFAVTHVPNVCCLQNPQCYCVNALTSRAPSSGVEIAFVQGVTQCQPGTGAERETRRGAVSWHCSRLLLGQWCQWLLFKLVCSKITERHTWEHQRGEFLEKLPSCSYLGFVEGLCGKNVNWVAWNKKKSRFEWIIWTIRCKW